MTHAQKVEAVREHLERWCVGWELRRLGARIVRDLRKRGFKMSEETFQHITKELILNAVFVGSDDTRSTGGYYIVTCRREANDCIAQLDRRIDGTLTRRDAARKLRDELFPQRELVEAATEGASDA